MRRLSSNDISKNALDKLTKVRGDNIVTGFVRFKRVHGCKNYKDAQNRAALRLSVVKGGRPLEGEYYAAVIRFRLLVYLIPLIALLLFMLIWFTNTRANNVIEETTEYVIEPEDTIPDVTHDDYGDGYMDIPGFGNFTMTDNSHEMLLYNPENNSCLLQYKIYVQDMLVYESAQIYSGESEAADFFQRLQKGRYSMTIQTTGYSPDGKTQFNTVNQTVELNVY